MSNEVRMVIAFVLMGLILVATPFAYRKLGINSPQTTEQKTADQKTADEKAADSKPAAAPTASGAPMTPSSAPVEGTVVAESEQEQVIDTAFYRVIFSNRGAVVKSWTLKDHKDSIGNPLELVNKTGAAKVGYPFTFAFRGKQPTTDLNKALWVGHREGLTMKFNFSDGQTIATKTFAFQQSGYITQYADEVTLAGAGIPHLLQWRGGFGDMAVYSAAGQQAAIRFDTEKNKLIREAAKTAKNGPVNNDGAFAFAGIDDQYFAAAFLTPPNAALQTTVFDDVVASPLNPTEDPYPGVAVGGLPRNQLGIFVGPKEVNLLHQVNATLDGIVDWGFFGIIAKPLFLVLRWLNDQYVHSYGWAIILLTLLINVAMFPLKLTNFKSMRKMQSLQPELAKINEKFKGISMSDPRAANKQQETMDLYKKHGVNPMGGCIPMLIQMPFLWAFYKVLSVSIEMRHASWLWVGDLSQPEHQALRMLPIIMVASGFLLQKMTPAPAASDPSQQKMMQFMPLMMGFFFWPASSGLVLYWLTGNLVGIGQQWFFNQTAGPVEARAALAKQAIVKDGRKRA